MNKKIKDHGGDINPLDWKRHEEDSEELYSYIKKKGKHKRAKEDSINK
tara:strand:+ start:77 stop:220 length:144 start_codon:yes stop_codon:yes gene_type:complete